MKKVFLIGWKDVRLAFRDGPALILMLAAPFILTVGLGFVTGRFSGGAGGLSDIPVIVVNQDGGQLGDALANVFTSADLKGLVEPVRARRPRRRAAPGRRRRRRGRGDHPRRVHGQHHPHRQRQRHDRARDRPARADRDLQ